jgi:hypothetical protein
MKEVKKRLTALIETGRGTTIAGLRGRPTEYPYRN